MTEKLKPCPSVECGSEEINARVMNADCFIECWNCGMRGPVGDPAGEKWNALPRREDVWAAQQMTVLRNRELAEAQLERDHWRKAAMASGPEAVEKLAGMVRSQEQRDEREEELLVRLAAGRLAAGDGDVVYSPQECADDARKTLAAIRAGKDKDRG